MRAVADEYVRLADVLAPLPEAAWDTASLCDGWRVREVVAHVTMPVRYGTEAFLAELAACGGDFTKLSNVVAARDSALPTTQLLDQLRSDGLHEWIPPGGGEIGALSHAVIHGLDVTVPLGLVAAPPPAAHATVLDALAGGVHAHFGVSLDGVRLEATDADWSFGSGDVRRGGTDELILWLSGRGPLAVAPGTGARSGSS